MALEPLDEAETAPLEDLRVELPPVVHDDDHRRVRAQARSALRRSTRAIAVDVLVDRAPARPASRGAELALAPVVEAEELVRVAVLLVVVDETRVRRRREDAVEAPVERDVARVAVQRPRPLVTRSRTRWNALMRSSVSRR